jgi:hypothetical protein
MKVEGKGTREKGLGNRGKLWVVGCVLNEKQPHNSQLITHNQQLKIKANSFWLNYKRTYFCTPVKTVWIELVAQLVEQYTFNVWALGSSPSGFTS